MSRSCTISSRLSARMQDCKRPHELTAICTAGLQENVIKPKQ